MTERGMRAWALALSGLLAACGTNQAGGSDGAAGRGPGGGRAAGGDAAMPVRTERVQRGEITSYIETHARLEAERWVDVVSRVQGQAERLAAEEGDRVRAGQTLVELEKEELRLQREQARVQLDQARASFGRTKALHERQLVSQEEFESARNQVENAEVALSEAALRLEYAEVRAPIDGVVMQRQVERGDLVRANDVVFVVADLDPLQTRIRVPEKRMTQVRSGQEASIAVDPAPGRTFPATVRMINPGVDPSSGTVKVTLDVPSAGGPLKPGMFATVRLVTDRHAQALILPKKALLLETDDDDVFRVRDGRAERVRIQLGYTDGDRVEVLSGLGEGDEVITVGQEGLKEGAAVRVVDEAGQVGAVAGADLGGSPGAGGSQ